MTGDAQGIAPGWPGIPARWTSSDKSGVGTALGLSSRIWFTLGHGILDEVYYPRVDQACTRDLGLIVTDGGDFFSEEKRHARHEVHYPHPGVPLYHLVNTCSEGRYRIQKWVLTDPRRDTVLQRIRFEALQGETGDYRLFALLAPHLGNHGAGNTAWVDDYKGLPVLFACRDGDALALACSLPWRARSAGFVGSSDGWQDLNRHKRLEWRYARAENGNVALTGEMDLRAGDSFELALGFGRTPEEAGYRARATLQDGFDAARDAYVTEWQDWQRSLLTLDEGRRDAGPNPYRTSTLVLGTHESGRFPGGIIASLSIPWGFSKGDNDLGGYHVVWPRDLVESAGALLAAGADDAVRSVLDYLQATQEADGHWLQNFWLDGTAYWSGIQLDETAFPILLVDLVYRAGVLGEAERERFWPMARSAASFLVRSGPVTGQDRWEEDAGYSPFTLAVEIAALLVAAEMADDFGTPEAAEYLRDTADLWNDRVEDWTYAVGTPLAQSIGVEGYYVRIAPPLGPGETNPLRGCVTLKNQAPGNVEEPATHLVSPDALALVRFGLRAPDDPRIRNTVRVIDELLRIETPVGPAWHRYNDDGYGEHADGSPFDGSGIGRAWPLLTGERAHYELAADNPEEARRLLGTLEGFANDGGMLPEQVWDAPDIPGRELFFGKPSGSAMPLVWAHAEHVKLLRSLRDERVFDTPPQTVRRYLDQHTGSAFAAWRPAAQVPAIPAGKTLRIELLAPATVHWSTDAWATTHDTPTRDTGLGVHLADLPTAGLPAGGEVVFTFRWTAPERWQNTNYSVTLR